jgi:LSD1 subclass zinc finger protein
MIAKAVCSSCKTPLANTKGSIKFACPQCSKTELHRCAHCRTIAATYTCPECGFSGPN